MTKKRKILIGAAATVLILIVIGVAASGEGEDVTPAAARAPDFTLSAQQLYDEREANATRYDATYKGKTVQVSGVVVAIDGGSVSLGIDTGFGIDTMGLTSVKLDDLPDTAQASLDKGDEVAAVCRVGEYIIGSIFMEDCELR